MSSYLTGFWSGWVIVLTAITLILVTALLFANRKRTPLDRKPPGTSTTALRSGTTRCPAGGLDVCDHHRLGHRLPDRLPGYGKLPGVLGWTSLEQHDRKSPSPRNSTAPMRDRYLAMPIEEIYHDPKARKMGMRIYGNNCSQCHGLDAGGALGFPNLADNDWLYGGSADMIKHTIVNGRRAAMPAWESILGDEGIAEATAYILSLNSRDADPAKVKAGEKHYQTYCVACHGPEGKGNQAMGAPNLTNGIWLYGGNAEQIAHSLRIGRNGQMPAFANTLGEDKIHLVSAYIYGLNRRSRAHGSWDEQPKSVPQGTSSCGGNGAATPASGTPKDTDRRQRPRHQPGSGPHPVAEQRIAERHG